MSTIKHTYQECSASITVRLGDNYTMVAPSPHLCHSLALYQYKFAPVKLYPIGCDFRVRFGKFVIL